jgi:leucyl-tRNA synthetase
MVGSAVASTDKNIDIGQLIKETMKSAPQEARREIPAFAKEIATEVSRTPVDERRDAYVAVDELEALGRAKRFFSDQFGCEVQVFSADDPARVDPKGRARHARPGRPAVYVE